MRRLVRTTVAAAAAVTGLLFAAPAAPAAAEGQCVELYLYITNPPTGTTVCTPDV